MQSLPAPGAKAERIHAMDALRAFLMLFGVFVHARTLTTTEPGMNAIEHVSALFRMEGFFLLSGFLAAMSLAKVTAAAFEKKRMPAVVVPFFLVLPTNLVVLYLIGVYAMERATAFPAIEVGALPGPWHLHLWFLIVLAVFTLLAPLLHSAARTAARMLMRAPLPAAALGLALILGMTLMSRGTLAVAMRPFGGEPTYLVLAFFAYTPFYFLGMIAWHHAGLRGVLIAPSNRDAAVWAAVLAVGAAGLSVGPDRGAFLVLTEAAVGLAIFGVLSFAFNRLCARRIPAVAFLADAAYTVYLLHYLCVWLVFAALGGAIASYWVIYVAAVAFAFAVTLTIHAFVIRRSPLLRFLLNGKPMRKATSVPTGATASAAAS